MARSRRTEERALDKDETRLRREEPPSRDQRKLADKESRRFLIRQLRDRRDKARDVANRQRREMRRQGGPRPGRRAPPTIPARKRSSPSSPPPSSGPTRSAIAGAKALSKPRETRVAGGVSRCRPPHVA